MKRIGPDKTQMEAYLSRGLTQQQIADQYEEDTGIRVTRSTIGMAIARYGLASNQKRERYDDLLPWRVSKDHAMDTEARLLRWEARRRRELPVPPDKVGWLDNWLKELDEKNAVVDYRPELGFVWVERTEDDTDIVRRPRLTSDD